jgi:hypothetical protein
MGYPSDVTDNQWETLLPILTQNKRGPKHSNLRTVLNDTTANATMPLEVACIQVRCCT